MIQAILRNGKILPEEVPVPAVRTGCILIKVINSCISAGTEVSAVTSSGKKFIEKSLENPENIRKFLHKLRSGNLVGLYKKVRSRKEQSDKKSQEGKPIGYSISGIVIACGEGVNWYSAGDRVAAAGMGYANHAEFVDVPENLVVKIPGSLAFPEASTITLGAIALQGVRRANLALGEYCAVIGVGLLGLLTVQLLKVSGIRVIAIDIDESRLKIAASLGAELCLLSTQEDMVKQVQGHTLGYGVDAVIFTAATKNPKVLSSGFALCKKKGKLVMVGVGSNEVRRDDLYQKELDFLISTSYGPGRYDPSYEEKGQDYPYAYVRWTENRNMQEYLRLLAEKKIDVAPLITNTFSIDRVTEAYRLFESAESRPLMVLLEYPAEDSFGDSIVRTRKESRIIVNPGTRLSKKLIRIALIGAGGFARNVHLPILRSLSDKFILHSVTDVIAHVAQETARQYGASYASTDADQAIADEEADLVLIATRHDSHAELVVKALQHHKHVFVEKPMATTLEELDQIEKQLAGMLEHPLLFVGYNRRFSPLIRAIRPVMENRINPLMIHYRMNAGYYPPDHWVHEAGGRIIGEGCHIIDLFQYLTGSTIEDISYASLHTKITTHSGSDNKAITFSFTDGSLATLHYFSTGNPKLDKEYMELHFDGKSILMNNYCTVKWYGIQAKELELKQPSKGHKEEWLAVHEYLSSPDAGVLLPIEMNSLIASARASILINGYFNET
jgi:predicted dehydrogenase/threonine dehydrogenase-like Zn-dependent dehydrogenase